ncbi:SDR family oxidoreductase [Bowmanella denitrificans]|uniref:SDR family oxidoreductase n=1 Tax=Bowmanella denitrificans TaxID=366582 RepID=A0ABN0XKR2_9ALTE
MASDLDRLFRLDNRVVIITGAMGLLGQRHARAVAAYGGIPVLLDLQKQPLQKFAQRLAQEFAIDVGAYSVDITDEIQIAANCHALLERYGKIDALVNNAANNPKMEQGSDKSFSRLEYFSAQIWQQDIAVGLTGAFLCAKHYGFAMTENPAGGSIVNVASDLGLIAPDQRLYSQADMPIEQRPVKPVTYSVVKTGLIGLTRYLATYWAENGVRANAICPGGVENGQPQDFIERLSSRIPMNRMARVDEYQGTLVWMLSDASSYLNGAVVAVDGGRTAW